jgi:3',5'-cyclic AMP phosphodiesterase CpdA
VGLTIAHFTDIHITRPPVRIRWRELLSKRVVGWANLRFSGRFKHLKNAVSITSVLVEDIVALAPDHVLFTGDVSSLSLREEFEDARRVLAPLIDAMGAGGATGTAAGRITGIPGNHDVYTGAAAKADVFGELFGDWLRSDDDAKSPILRLLGDEVALIALIDSRPTELFDSSGKVGEEQLKRLDALLDDSRLSGRRRILALHYGPRRADGSRDTNLHGLRDSEELLQLIGGRVDLVVHGHLHDRFVLEKGARTPVTIANPGSATHGAHDRAYHLLHVDDGGIRISARRYDDERQAFVEWPDAPGIGAS